MELLKDELVLEKIAEHKVDAIFFEKIDRIKEVQEKLTFIGESYINSLARLEDDSELLSQAAELFGQDLNSLDDLKSFIVDLANRLDYIYCLPDTEFVEGVGKVTMLCDEEKEAYKLLSIYTDKSIEGSPTKTYSMFYSFSDEVDTRPEIFTEARMYVGSSCQCCEKVEYKVIFPQGEDVDHYIIVSELEGIYKRLEAMMEEYKSIYEDFMGLLGEEE